MTLTTSLITVTDDDIMIDRGEELTSDNEALAPGPGRPKHTVEKLWSLLQEERRKVKALQTKLQVQSSQQQLLEEKLKQLVVDKSTFSVLSKDELLLDLIINRSAVLFAKINGQLQLSPQAGSLLIRMHAISGVLIEKMSLVLTQILELLFGELKEETVQQLVRCPNIISASIMRANDLVREDGHRIFVQPAVLGFPGRPDDVRFSNIMIDASHNGDNSLSARAHTYRGYDDKIRFLSYSMDKPVSKKGEDSSDFDINRLKHEITARGLAFTTSGSSEAAAAAFSELRKVLIEGDHCRVGWKAEWCYS